MNFKNEKKKSLISYICSPHSPVNYIVQPQFLKHTLQYQFDFPSPCPKFMRNCPLIHYKCTDIVQTKQKKDNLTKQLILNKLVFAFLQTYTRQQEGWIIKGLWSEYHLVNEPQFTKLCYSVPITLVAKTNT